MMYRIPANMHRNVGRMRILFIFMRIIFVVMRIILKIKRKTEPECA